ncbi:hypothetical protein R5R35_013713 [Gryllus longicercus]|uniref:RING-type domain-containing protein n=1 Tax=Gryllus longicercus TaxID=2509291 RepID=A0AAN9VRF2_9ORTH
MGKAEELKDAGNKHFKNEEYFKAIKCYKEGLLLDPGNPTINCNLAQAYLAVKEFAEAEVHAVVTLAHQADSVKGFYRATKAALGMSKKDRALSYLRTGLVNCPKADELKTLYEEINKENGDGEPSSSNSTSSKPHLEKEETKKHTKIHNGAQEEVNSVVAERSSRSDQNKFRSRSSGSRNRNNSKDPTDKASVRSVSVNRSSNEKSLSKRNSEPKSDAFIDTLVKLQTELSPEEKSPQQKEREALMEKQKKLQVFMKEGYEAMEMGSTKQASEKYKCALDIMGECDIKVFGMPEINRIVLRYTLSICWIETLNYNNIVQSVGCLMEIETLQAEDLPAVYYGLGRAFYRLNRFKVALGHLNKGLEMIENMAEVVPHPWPGTIKLIVETTKVGLKESLNKLCYECRTYREPDAVCRYKECLNVSSHICPSEIIFYSDPDFVGYVVIICQENCKITYHVGCWKHYKECLSSVGKLSDKDVLGKACLTSDCVNERNEISVIVRIEVYGEDGKIKTSCLKEPTKTDNVNEHRKERKKKNEKIEKPVKVKVSRVRVKKLPPSSQNIVKKVKRRSTISIEDISRCKQKLSMLREIYFGVDETISWNPRKDYFGRPDISTLKTFINSKDSEILRERKNFIYTYFYEYFNDEGPQKVSAIEKKWLEDISQFAGINEFMSEHDGICDFLLLSYRFACIDDYLCLADQLSDTYQRVQEEVGESLTFILSHSNHTIENEPEIDLVVNKCTRKLIEDTSSNSSIPDFPVERPGTITPSSSQGYSSGMPWNKRDSECDSYIIQDSSGSSSGEDSDYDGIITSDYENYDDFEKVNTTIDSNEPHININVEQVKESTPVSSQIPEKLIDTSYSPSAHCSSSAGSVYYELSDKDIKDLQIADAATQVVDLQLVLKKDADTQTDSSCDLERENEDLRTVNSQLLQAATMLNDEKQNLMSRFQEEINGYKQKIQLYESRLSSLVVEKEQNENDLQFQIGIRDSKIDAIIKKNHEEFSKLVKKNEEDAGLLKRNLETMSELNKEVEKQANTIIRLEDQLRRANEQILTIRKLFGEFKLDSYLAKCKERLQCMNIMCQWFQDNSSSADEIKPAIEAWERVAVSLQETRDLLQVQYDILSQQLKNKVSSDFLLQLELADLPAEPHYPLQDMNNVLRFTVEYAHHKNGSMNGKNVMNASRNNSQYTEILSTYTNSTLGVQNHSNQDLFNIRATNPFGYRPPFYPNSLSGPNTFSNFPRTMSPTHSNHLGHIQNSSEIKNSTVTGSWPPEFHVGGLRSDKPDHVTGGKPASGLRTTEPVTLPTFANHVSESRESLTSGECASHATGDTVTERKDGPSLIAETKQREVFGEKRASSSSASGLTPIEITRPGISGFTLKPMNFETKQAVKGSTQTPKRWNYQKLFEELQRFFRTIPEVELSESLFIVREKNANKLTGLSVSTIIRRVEKVLEDRSSKKIGNMGMDKFGCAAWGEVKENDVSWQNDDVENECIICHINIEANSKTSLQCKHTFHTECIRQWLHTNSTCPICRKYTRLIDEFPPLA